MISIGIDESGFYRDRLETILARYVAAAKAIYGADRQLGPETSDGQLLGALAEAVDDCGQAIEDVYNGRNPDVATGQNLTSTCRFNGVNRLVGDYAYVNVSMSITAGAVVPAGTQVQDEDTGAVYASVAAATGTGSPQLVTCKALVKGSTSAAGKVVKIVNPTYGLTAVTNLNASTVVSAEETDEQLRTRRNLSTAAPTSGYLDSIWAGILATPGVGKVKVWENDTGNYQDVKAGDQVLPPHSIAVVVTAGSATAIGATLYARKSPGTGTMGTSEVVVADSLGIAHTMRYTVATPVEYSLRITYKERAGAGFGSEGGEAAVKAALVAWSNVKQLPMEDVYRGWVTAIAQGAVIGLDGLPAIVIEDVQLGRTSGTRASTDLTLLWNEVGDLLTENIVMEKLP